MKIEILIILLTYSICNIVIWGSIFQSFRDLLERWSPNFFYKLFTCFMCLGFWVGFTLSLLFQMMDLNQFSLTTNSGLNNMGLSIFFDACILSGTSWLINTIQEFLERSFRD
jgi:hypothetical protein